MSECYSTAPCPTFCTTLYKVQSTQSTEYSVLGTRYYGLCTMYCTSPHSAKERRCVSLLSMLMPDHGINRIGTYHDVSWFIHIQSFAIICFLTGCSSIHVHTVRNLPPSPLAKLLHTWNLVRCFLNLMPLLFHAPCPCSICSICSLILISARCLVSSVCTPYKNVGKDSRSAIRSTRMYRGFYPVVFRIM